MSSKKKRLAGRLAKYEIFDSGSCAFAKRADRRANNKVRNSGPLDVEHIAALLNETACVDLEEVDGAAGWSDACQRTGLLSFYVPQSASASGQPPHVVPKRKFFAVCSASGASEQPNVLVPNPRPPAGRDVSVSESTQAQEDVETTPAQLSVELAHENNSRNSNHEAICLRATSNLQQASDNSGKS